MYCEKCGNIVYDEDLFCQNCGAKIEWNYIPTPKNNEISAVVERAKSKDNEAFSKLFELTNQKAFYTALKITKNEDDAQDMLQEAYIKAFTSLDTLKDNSKFVSWFNCIVANKCRNYVVKAKPDLFSEYSSDDTYFEFEDTLEADNFKIPQEIVDNKETKSLVMDCIDKLPEDQKICVIMFYYDEMTVKEIAGALEIFENTVKSRLFHARKKLKGDFEILEKQGTKLYGAGVAPIIKFALGLDSTVVKPAVSMSAISTAVAAGAATASATAATGAVAATTIATGTSLAAKIVAASIAVTIAAGGTGTAVAIHNHNKEIQKTAVIETTKEPTTAIVLDEEHQRNVEEAMKYSDDDYSTNTKSSLAAEYNGYVYYTDYEISSNTTYGIFKKNLSTGEKEKILNVLTRELLIYDKYLFYLDYKSSAIYQLDLKSNSEPVKISKLNIVNEADGPTSYGYYSFYLKEGNIVYVAKDDDYEYYHSSVFVYNIKTKETKEILHNLWGPYITNEGIVSAEYPNENTYDIAGNLIDTKEYSYEASNEKLFENEKYIIISDYSEDLESSSMRMKIYNKLTGDIKSIDCKSYIFCIVDDILYINETKPIYDSEEVARYDEKLKTIDLKKYKNV